MRAGAPTTYTSNTKKREQHLHHFHLMDAQQHQTGGHICQCLNRISNTRRNSTLTIFKNRHKTGLQFVESVQRLASGLSTLGIKPGDIVAIAALNSDVYLEWMLAVAYAGAVIAPLNYRWSVVEARSALEVLQPVMFVVGDSCASWYLDLQTYDMPSLRWHVCLGDPLPFLRHTGNVLTSEILKSFPASVSRDYQWAPDGVVLICFTSGTSGRPKGVSIGHTALIVQSLAKIIIVGYSEDDVYLHTAPLCHIGGISSAMAMLMIGACHVFVPKFEPRSVLQAIEQHHVSSLITVPAIMADLISYIRSHKTWKAGENLKKILNGGGQLSVELIKDAAEIFPFCRLISAYGMTETCSSLTFMTLYSSPCEIAEEQHQNSSESISDFVNHLGVCVGKPAPHVELLVNSSNSPSSIGRILTRGPHVMHEYFNQAPVKISNSHHQGWLDTGDMGCLDEHGNVWLIGRSNDRIKSGGENIYPEEVEAILSNHPGVCSVVVVGVPDERFSEMVVACLQIKEGWKWVDQSSHSSAHEPQLCSDSLYQYCREKKLSRFKIPKIFIPWRRPFPLTSTGKLKRDEVKREAISLVHLYRSSSL